MNQIRSVWLAFNVLELILSAVCCGIHISGMLYEREPLPHHMYFCGIFCAFFLMPLLGIIGVYCGSKQKVIMEVIISGIGAICFLITAIFSMYYAERDFHLMYLSDLEESYHPFFMTSKAESIASLVTSVTYLLHFTFAIDAITITDDSAAKAAQHSSDSINSNYCALKPIKTNLICWSYFVQFEFCETCLKQIDGNEDSEYYFEHTKVLEQENPLLPSNNEQLKDSELKDTSRV